MHIERSLASTDHKTIVVMVAILAGLVGLLGFALSDPSVDLENLQTFAVAVAPVADAPTKQATAERPVGHAVAKTPEENWAPDESSHGLRPDAAH